MNNKKRIVVITTGGTILMSQSSEGVKPSLNGKALLTQAPGIHEIAEIELIEYSNVPSSWIGFNEWIKITRILNERLKSNFDGAVVIQGTDTIEESSYFLNLTVNTQKPVVITGAMRNSTIWDTDGPRNTRDAIRVAASKEAWGKGVMVVIGGEIHAARDVIKADRQSVCAFTSYKKGILGISDETGITFYRKPTKRHTYNSEFAPISTTTLPAVEMVYTYTDMNLKILDCAADVDTKGLVVVVTGIGNTDKRVYQRLAMIKEKRDIPVVISSRVPSGRVAPIYGYEGGGKTLSELGCIFAEDLHPLKARILLAVALTSYTENDNLKRIFKEY